MKISHFIVGNFWLLITLVLILGERGSEPVEFLRTECYMSPIFYGALKLCCLIWGIFLIYKSQKKDIEK